MKRSTLLHVALVLVATLALAASTGCYIYPAPQPSVPQMIGQVQPATIPDLGKPGAVPPSDLARPAVGQPPDPGKPSVEQPLEPVKLGAGQPPDPAKPGPGQLPDPKNGQDAKPVPVSPNTAQPPDPKIMGDPPRKEPVREASVNFGANRTNIKSGECAILNWNVQGDGAYWVELDAQRVDRTGQKQVCPQQTQTYNLHVDLGERVDRRDIVINVENATQQSGGQSSQNSQNSGNSQNSSNSQNSGNSQNTGNSNTGTSSTGCGGAPTFSTFTANKSTITLGESVTLSWGGVTNGNSSILVQSVTLTGVGEVGSPGSRSVTPSAAGTATYTLTATGCGGTAVKSVSIAVQKSGSGSVSPIPVTIIQFDLQLADLYANGAGQIMAKIKNNGPDVAKTSGKLSCGGTATIIPAPPNPPVMAVSGSAAFQANLKAGETMEVFTGISRNPSIITLIVTCKIEAGSTLLGDKANNELTKQVK